MPISKTPGVSDKDFLLRDADMRTGLERDQMIEELRHGNIYEVFAKSKVFKIGDFSDFFASQWKNFKGQIVQDAEIKSQEASYHEPSMEQFPMHHKGVSINAEEGQAFSQSMSDFLSKNKFKASTLDTEGFTSDLVDGTTEAEDVASMAQGTLDDWDVFLEDTWGTIFDQQMMADYRSRMSEIQAEVQRIISLAKSGAIGPEYVLLALAKVNQTKNGCLMTWLGKKAYHINESMNNVAQELSDSGGSDFSLLTTANSETREGNFNMNLLTQDIQKVMQDVSSTLEFVHSTLNAIDKTKMEIIRKYSAQG